jgi:phage tail sheath protein FI
MPEYLAPGVYVEEVSFRSKSIEGVPTSTTGFAGMTRYGPVQYPGGPKTSEPRLVTSFTEFERVYGGLESLELGATGQGMQPCYVAHAARAFFDNGGKRLYVSRVFLPRGPAPADMGVASFPVSVVGPPVTGATWTARWPGRSGNVLVETRVRS